MEQNTTPEKNTLLQKSHIFRYWPPFIRAYRQNAKGMEVTAQQQKYLRWGTVLLVAFFTLAWFLYSLPYFRNQADISLFTYTGDFVRPFFDNTTSLRISEFLWRFVVQFYFNLPLMILVVAFMVIGFCVTSWKTAGPYTPFLLPLFFLLFSSSEPAQASIAISLWLCMGALAFYFSLFRLVARHPRAWAPLILLHTVAAFFSVALYYAAGHWALVFSIAVVCVHLIGIPMAVSDKETRLWKIRLWNLIISVLIAVLSGFFSWKISSYPGFRAAWYVWVAMIVYFLACLPGIVLQAYNNRKVFLYEYNRRHGVVQDGKPALTSPYNVKLTLVALALGCVLVFGLNRDPLSRSLVQVQNAVSHNDYTESLRICDRYYQRYGNAFNREDRESMQNRYHLSSYLRLSLLMTGQLGNRFFEYASLPEVAWMMYPMPLPFVGAQDYSYIKTYESLGLAAPSVPQILSCIELFGLQNRFIEPLVKAEIATGQYRLLENTFYYARKTFYAKKFYHLYRSEVKQLTAACQDGSRPVSLQDSTLREGGYFIDDWVQKEFEYRFASDPGTINAALGDYYTFLMLLEKKMDKIPTILEHYGRMDNKTLPVYLQEAICIQAGYPQHISKKKLLSASYGGFRLSAASADAVSDTYVAYQAMKQNKISFEEVQRKYGDTYTFYWLFAQMR